MKSKNKKMRVLGGLYGNFEGQVVREGWKRYVCQVVTSRASAWQSGTVSVVLHL